MQTSNESLTAYRIVPSLDDSSLPSFASQWRQRALGVALALSRDGHFEWEDFRHALRKQLESCDSEGETSSAYCQRWLLAIEGVMQTAGLVDAGTLAPLRELALEVALPPQRQDG